MKATPHGTINGYQRPYRCRCNRCVEAAREYRQLPRVKQAQRKAETAYKAINRDGINRGKQWTGAELEFVTACDPEGRYLRSAKVCAEKLGRSVLAVERARQKCRVDPRYDELIGVNPGQLGDLCWCSAADYAGHYWHPNACPPSPVRRQGASA